jgi:uncharacterized membrane protein YeaQ/YmgE (transglycosylase-associated protein family)
MSLVVALIIGGIVGWLAAQLLGRDEGFIASILIGIVGSVIGGFLSSLFNGTDQSYFQFTWAGVIWSFIGALVLVAILNTVQHRTVHHV